MAKARPIPIDDDTMDGFLGQVAQEIHNAATARARLARYAADRALELADDADRQYQRSIQAAGEMWAKSALMVFGVEPHQTHHMDELAARLHAKAPDDPSAQSWLERIDDLNGHSAHRRLGPYDGKRLEPVPDADDRFQRTCGAIGDWLDQALLTTRAAPHEQSRRATMLRSAKYRVTEAVGYVEDHRDARRLPPDVAQALLDLDHQCTQPGQARPQRPNLESAAGALDR